MKRLSVTDLADQAIQDTIAKEKYNTFPLRPSSAGKCARALAYETDEWLNGADHGKKPFEPAVYRLLDLGKNVEESALKHLELIPGAELKYKQQVVTLFSLDHGNMIVEGSIDGAFFCEELKAIIDIKSQKDSFSQSYQTRWTETCKKYDNNKFLEKVSANEWYCEDLSAFVEDLGDDFLVDNLLQINAYCRSRFAMERGVNTGIVFKYNKNDSRQYVIQFKPDPELFNDLKWKYNAIHQAVLNKEPETIPRPYNLGSIRCAFCPYQKTCWGQDALKAWFRTMPGKEFADNLEGDDSLSTQFGQYEVLLKSNKARQEVEQEIIKEMLTRGLKKVKLSNGNIYETKYYKSPRERIELKRSK